MSFICSFYNKYNATNINRRRNMQLLPATQVLNTILNVRFALFAPPPARLCVCTVSEKTCDIFECHPFIYDDPVFLQTTTQIYR